MLELGIGVLLFVSLIAHFLLKSRSLYKYKRSRAFGHIRIQPKRIHRLKRRISKNRSLITSLFYLRFWYVDDVRSALRKPYEHPGAAISILTLATTILVFGYFSSEPYVAATTFYASFIFWNSYFKDNPLLKVVPRVEVRNFGEDDAKFMVRVKIVNTGDGNANNINARFRILNRNGLPLTHWRDLLNDITERDVIQGTNYYSLEPGEDLDIEEVKMNAADGIIDAEPPERRSDNVKYYKPSDNNFSEGLIFLECTARTNARYSLKSGRIIFPIKITQLNR